MLIERMIRAARLESALFDEVEHDLNATSQALTVVMIVALASGIGQAIGFTIQGRPGEILSGFIGGIVGAVIGWLVWALVTYLVGTAVFGGVATYGEMLRCLGFANTPGLLGFFVFIPCLGPLLAFVGAIWTLVAGIIAVRQAMDFTTGRAILTAILGWFTLLLVSAVLALLGLGFLRALF